MTFKYELLSQPSARRPPSLLHRYRFVIMLVTVLALVYLTTVCSGRALPFNVAKKSRWEPLRFDEDGNFQLAIFEDLHFGESESIACRIGADGLLTGFNRCLGLLGPTTRPQLSPRPKRCPRRRDSTPRHPQRRPHHRGEPIQIQRHLQN